MAASHPILHDAPQHSISSIPGSRGAPQGRKGRVICAYPHTVYRVHVRHTMCDWQHGTTFCTVLGSVCAHTPPPSLNHDTGCVFCVALIYRLWVPGKVSIWWETIPMRPCALWILRASTTVAVSEFFVHFLFHVQC